MSGHTGPTWHPFAFSVLLVAFAARVLAQFVQNVAPTDLLPAFESFESGAVPYLGLLGSQIAVLVVGVAVVARLRRPGPPWSAPVRAALSVAGATYLIVMLFRLWLGTTERYDRTWFDEAIPTVFHLVLATSVLILAHAEWSRPGAGLDAIAPARSEGATGPTADLVAVVLYPVVVGSAVVAFALLSELGAPATLAAYGTVAVATATILAAEWRWPARVTWRPATTNLFDDGLFMVVVQILLPAAVGVGLTVLLSAAADGLGLTLGGVWPHDWPVPIQIVMMLLIGDAARYWLHRFSHQPNALWRLHAVHHSPDRLYSLNVARFHPFDKALQYAFDTLPFVALAVGEPVLLGYFVFYAVNGFFQHSNCHIRLGPLNWVVSGPELHRWHHSRIIAESDQNFGNNLIIWDVLFGTRFLPGDRVVGELGLLNRSYPSRFLGQMTSVFVPGLDKHPVPKSADESADESAQNGAM